MVRAHGYITYGETSLCKSFEVRRHAEEHDLVNVISLVFVDDQCQVRVLRVIEEAADLSVSARYETRLLHTWRILEPP